MNQLPPADEHQPASAFEQVFWKAGVLTEELNNAKSEKSRATQIGKFLARNIGREVAIEVNGGSGKAVLCMLPARSNQKHYRFEIRWDEPPPAGNAPGESTGDIPLDDGLGRVPDADIAAAAAAPASVPVDAAQTPEHPGRQEGDDRHDSGNVGNKEQW